MQTRKRERERKSINCLCIFNALSHTIEHKTKQTAPPPKNLYTVLTHLNVCMQYGI